MIDKITNHRRRLLDLFIKAGASSSVDVKVGNVTMARIFDNLAQAVLIADLTTRYKDKGFFRTLAEYIPDFPFYYADQDEQINVVRAAAPTRMDAYFEDVEAKDLGAKDIPGSSQSTKHLWIQNLSNQVASTVTGNIPLAQSAFDMPSGLSLFTDGTRLSPNNRFTLYCIAANVPINVGSKSTRFHLFDERIELFTSGNNEGLLIDPSVSSELAFQLAPLKLYALKTPYTFEPNRRMVPSLDVTDDGVNHLAINTQQVFLIGMREILSGGA